MVNVSTWVSIQPKTNQRPDRITAVIKASTTPQRPITEANVSTRRVGLMVVRTLISRYY
jgi:hypothetical protein